MESMSPIKPIRSFSVAILNQRPILVSTQVEKSSDSIEPMNVEKTKK